MGLFDFLRPKIEPVRQEKLPTVERAEADISKTYLIADLFKVAQDQRDKQWYKEFYENVADASFACASPQVLTGPDGFPYFILKTPEINQPFESFCIRNMMGDFLLEKGWGVVFNPKEDETADWVFTHGGIVNLQLRNEFLTVVDETDTNNIKFTKTVGVTTRDEQVMISQPSESYLPRPTRAALKKFLQRKGIKTPKLMMLSAQEGGKVIRKLALNIHPENYPVVSQLDHLMQQVGWFLPNDYILIPLPKNSSLAKGFNEM